MNRNGGKDNMTAAKRAAVIERLDLIAKAGNGVLTPDAVVEDTRRDKESPLREFFTWDVKEAARERWVDQARALIASVHYVVTTEYRELRVNYYVRDPEARPGEQGYRQTQAIRDDPDMARATMLDELRRLRGLIERCRALAVALGEEETIEELSRLVASLNQRIGPPTQ